MKKSSSRSKSGLLFASNLFLVSSSAVAGIGEGEIMYGDLDLSFCMQNVESLKGIISSVVGVGRMTKSSVGGI